MEKIRQTNTAKIVNSYDDLQRLVSQSYKVGTNEVKKSLYTITSDNRITSVENQRNGVAENNWQYEYFTNMPGLKSATLNSGSGNTQYDEYSKEEFEYDLAGNPYRYRVGSSNWNVVSSNKNKGPKWINISSGEKKVRMKKLVSFFIQKVLIELLKMNYVNLLIRFQIH